MPRLKGKKWDKIAKKFAKTRRAINTNPHLTLAAMKEIYIPQIKKGTYKPKNNNPQNGG